MNKFLGKDRKIYIAIHDKVGEKANEVSDVWSMGFHVFDSKYDGDRTYRLVYFKTKKARYYSQITIRRKNAIPQTDCSWK